MSGIIYFQKLFITFFALCFSSVTLAANTQPIPKPNFNPLQQIAYGIPYDQYVQVGASQIHLQILGKDDQVLTECSGFHNSEGFALTAGHCFDYPVGNIKKIKVAKYTAQSTGTVSRESLETFDVSDATEWKKRIVHRYDSVTKSDGMALDLAVLRLTKTTDLREMNICDPNDPGTQLIAGGVGYRTSGATGYMGQVTFITPRIGRKVPNIEGRCAKGEPKCVIGPAYKIEFQNGQFVTQGDSGSGIFLAGLERDGSERDPCAVSLVTFGNPANASGNWLPDRKVSAWIKSAKASLTSHNAPPSTGAN